MRYGRHWETYAAASVPGNAPITSATTAISSQRENALACDGKLQLARLDLCDIKNSIDQAQEVAAVALNALQHLADLRWDFAIDIILDKLGITEDRVEGRSEF